MKNMSPSTQTNKVRKKNTAQSTFYWDHVLTQLSIKREKNYTIYKKSMLCPYLNKVVTF